MSASRYVVVDPATGGILKRYETITDADLESAIGRAEAAHGVWGRETRVGDRAAAVARVADLHTERRQELAEIIGREMGKPLSEALAEVDFSATIYRYYADNIADFMKDEPIELLAGGGSACIRRSSLGVLLGVMPWNFPYYQVARFAGPNLATGNTILLKHASQCPESAEAMEAIFRDAGLPDGAYVNLYATSEQIAKVVADPRVQGVSLTGSERAGAAVAELAGRHLKKVVLELGGANPFVLLSTDDLDGVVQQAVASRLRNTGQSCNIAKRFIVLDELYDAFLERFTAALTSHEPGDPASPHTTIGPLSSVAAAEELEQQVDTAVRHGARLVAGGGRDRTFFQPAVLTDVAPDNPAYVEEFFGPVAQVYRVASEAEAIALANDTPFGLGAYVFTTDKAQATRVTDRIEAGMVFVNMVGPATVELPFGGVKASGFGRELGRLGADEFVNKKMVRVA